MKRIMILVATVAGAIGLTASAAGATANTHAACAGYNNSIETKAGPQAISNEILPYVGPGFGTDIVGIFAHSHAITGCES